MGILNVQSGSLVVNGALEVGIPLGGGSTDDFSSYSVGAFPQSPWTNIQTAAGFTSNIVASSAAFGTQNVELRGNGSPASVTLAYTPTGAFINGEVKCQFSVANAASNVQPAVALQIVDGNNMLSLRYRTDTDQMLLYEIAGGNANLRGNFTSVSLLANTVYVMRLRTNGTNAEMAMLDATETTTIAEDDTVGIVGNISGLAGIRLVSQSTTRSNFDNFTVTP